MAGEVIKAGRKPTTINVLNGYSVNCLLNSFLYLHGLTQPSALIPSQIIFLLQGTAVNTEVCNWSKNRGYPPMEYSAIKETSVSNLCLPQGSGKPVEERMERL